MVIDDICAALRYGAAALTPNRRLARHMQELYANRQRSAGLVVWETPTILPWDAWIDALWHDAATEIDLPLLLNPVQASRLWERVLAAAFEATPWLSLPAAAERFAAAWALFHAWSDDADAWRTWVREHPGDDVLRFITAATAFDARCRRHGWIDGARASDVLATGIVAGDVDHLLPRELLCVGFAEMSPQQKRMTRTLAARGVSVAETSLIGEGKSIDVVRTLASSSRDEMVAALQWAATRARREPDATIAIVIEDLATRRTEVAAIAEEVLAPGQFLPGATERTLPYNLSLGEPLAARVLIASALKLIALGHGELGVVELSSLVRSPYLVGASEERSGRAAVELELMRTGAHSLDLSGAIEALSGTARTLATRWSAWRDARVFLATAQSPRAWCDIWRSWLEAAGWPGMRPLGSVEFQLQGAWDDLLRSFATLQTIDAMFSGSSALAAVTHLASITVFQPESPAPRIQILGLLEAAGLPFDYLWVAGLDAGRWPKAPEPEPLLSQRWQRAHKVPRSSAARELAYAQALTASFAASGKSVVFSVAQKGDDRDQDPSPLIVSYPLRPLDALELWPYEPYPEIIKASATLETLIDEVAPALAPGVTVTGGTGVIASQGDCPFQAFARRRLMVEPWQGRALGLRAPERGQLVHEALAQFFRVVHDHASLSALSATARAATIGAAVDHALSRLPQRRWRALPAPLRDVERHRLSMMLSAWLELEAQRPPFTVIAIEEKGTLSLAGLTFALRIDRCDRVVAATSAGAGREIIIDYKTGEVEPLKCWLEPRIGAPQLPMYVLSRRARADALPVAGVAFATLRAEAVTVTGVRENDDGKNAAAWPALTPIQKFDRSQRIATFADLERSWQEKLFELAMEFANGVATVTPRSLKTCDKCHLHALCRIAEHATFARDVEPMEDAVE